MTRLRSALLASLFIIGQAGGGVPAQAVTKPAVDLYEDLLCPFCAAFDQQYGAGLDEAAATGRITLRYNFVNKLDKLSASGDYSTRAAAAVKCVDKFVPAKSHAFRSRLFAPDTQPQEQGDSDLSNEDLAKVATKVSADAAVSCIREGAEVAAAKSAAASAWSQLTALGGQGVPSVVKDGKLVDVDSSSWLADLSK